MNTPATVLLVLLLAAALPAHAQLYRCVDAKGRVSYLDKPGPGCTLGRGDLGKKAPPPAAKAAKGAAGKDGKGAKSAPKPPPETAAQIQGRCTSMRQQLAWLASKRGEDVPGREARMAQIEKELQSCPPG